MRTTVRIDGQVLAEAKRLAAETGHTLTAVIEESLKETLARRKKSKGSGPVKLTLYGGEGVFPGVDLDDTASLLDSMEQSR
jgi:hypothetical protein